MENKKKVLLMFFLLIIHFSHKLFSMQIQKNKIIDKCFIEKDINSINNNGWPKLCLACYGKKSKEIKALVCKLIENGQLESINKQNIFGESPIFLLCRNNDFKNLKYLLEKMEKFDVFGQLDKSKCLQEVFYVACENENDCIIDFLLGKGARRDINSFCLACKKNNLKLVSYLFDDSLDINSCDNSGSTALCIACENEKFELAEELIKKGADVNFVNSKKQTPLGIACRKGDFDTVKLLLNNGAEKSINVVNEITKSYCSTAFCLAFYNNKFDIMSCLIEKGINVNFEFYQACKNGAYSFVVYLVEKLGANINFFFKDSFLINLAVNNNYFKIMSFLLRKNGGAPEDFVEFLKKDDLKIDSLMEDIINKAVFLIK